MNRGRDLLRFTVVNVPLIAPSLKAEKNILTRRACSSELAPLAGISLGRQEKTSSGRTDCQGKLFPVCWRKSNATWNLGLEGIMNVC